MFWEKICWNIHKSNGKIAHFYDSNEETEKVFKQFGDSFTKISYLLLLYQLFSSSHSLVRYDIKHYPAPSPESLLNSWLSLWWRYAENHVILGCTTLFQWSCHIMVIVQVWGQHGQSNIKAMLMCVPSVSVTTPMCCNHNINTLTRLCRLHPVWKKPWVCRKKILNSFHIAWCYF